jgi:two-component system, NtrC family, sensor histidine kinase HydH
MTFEAEGADARDGGLVAALSELATRVQRGRKVGDVLRIAGDGVLALGLRLAAFQVEGDHLVLRRLASPPARVVAIEQLILRPLRGLRAPIAACAPAGSILGGRKIHYSRDLDLFDRFLAAATGHDLAPLDAAPATAGIPNGVLAPIFARDKAWGLLTLVGESFLPTDAAAVALFATHVGSAIEVAEFVGALEAAQKELVERERLAALGELAAVIAHEVRNPLAAMFNAVASLRRIVRASNAPEDASTLVAILGEEAERINCIVSDLVDFARPMVLRRRKASLQDIFTELHDSAAARPEAATVGLEFDAPATLPPVDVDPRLVRQALFNLVLNAMQAAKGGRVLVRARSDGDTRDGRVLIDIADSGPGIAAADQPRIFEPFFTTKAAGTGLGLPLVERVVEAHEGTLSFSSSSAGTTFTIALPVAVA